MTLQKNVLLIDLRPCFHFYFSWLLQKTFLLIDLRPCFHFDDLLERCSIHLHLFVLHFGTSIIINVAACSPESVAEFRSPDSVAECITSLTFLLLLVSPESVAEISGVDEAGGNVKAKHASKQQRLL